ncbi:biofilm regulation protein phosphatase SiaA [Oryzomicrobium sp.]|uniref:biofilm regulation protein phosphatase SiaA n=1 Tax=Oryzomicrobium sp. TaxID=1911578 RepID=UPI002FE25B51
MSQEQTEQSAQAGESRIRWGLRARTALLLFGLAAVLVVAGLLVGRQVTGDIRGHFGAAFARNNALLTQQRILSLLGRELALAERLADSALLREWIEDENNPEKRQRFFRDGDSYRRGFADQNFFLASALSGHYYLSDKDADLSDRPRYTLHRNSPDDAWFYATLDKVKTHAVNVNPDEKLRVTKVWTNVVVHDRAGRPIALTGTGFEFSRFLQDFVTSPEPGLTTLVINQTGTIVAHPDPSKVEYAAVSKADSDKSIFRQLDDDDARDALRAALAESAADSGRAVTLQTRLDGQDRLLALAYIPSLDWTVVTAVDLAASKVLDQGMIVAVGIGGAVLLLLIFALTTAGFDRLVLLPLARLTGSVRQIAAGRYDVRLRSRRRDEIGELTRAFDAMAQQVRAHTEELERRVEERTADLADANRKMAETHRKLTDSIRYASLIQSAILPDRDLSQAFHGEYFVLWLPRDVVGGDLYLYRANDDGCLFGVVDCAGHGVPGAFMTMIAHAAIGVAAADTPWNDPAALLARTDEVARTMLPSDDRFGQIATNMDMGLCYVDLRRGLVRFAGAKLSLFWSDGTQCHEIRGQRRGLNDRKPGTYENREVGLEPGRTFYLATDGLLDQAGGEHGYGFGERRLSDWVQANAEAPLAEQRDRLAAYLEAYRGALPQRDDITVMAFRFDNRP